VGVEWVVGEESKAQKIFGELLSDGEGRRCVGSAWVWRTKNRLALWPQNAARQRRRGTCTYTQQRANPQWRCPISPLHWQLAFEFPGDGI
jgi:hypothetical protein